MRRGWLIVMALSAAAHAEFDATRSYRLAPKSAALGGLSTGLESSPEGALLNPSMLPMNHQSALAGYAGNLGNSLIQAATASYSPWYDVALGIGWANFFDGRIAGAPTENEASLSLAARGNAHSLMGIRGKWMQLGGGVLSRDVQGLALDAGFQWGWQRLFGGPLGFSLGAQAVNLADTLPQAWSRALTREISVSSVFTLGRAFSWGLESAWSNELNAAGTAQSLRAGAEWRPLGFLALRGGWRTHESWSAGLGLKSALTGLSLDYAWLAAGPNGSTSRLGLSWNWLGISKSEQKVEAAPLPKLKPEFSNDSSGAISQVAIQMPAVASPEIKGWELKIQDEGGKAVRTMKGSGAMPSGLVWDGKNDMGKAVEGTMLLKVMFSYQDTGGVSFSSMQPLLTEASLKVAGQRASLRPRLNLEGLSRDFFSNQFEPAWSEKFLEGAID